MPHQHHDAHREDTELGGSPPTSKSSTTEPHRATGSSVPSTGFLRLTSIIGNPNAIPPQPALIPVCRATWWKGCKTGRFPKPIKIGRATAWRVEDILDLIERIGNREAV